MSSDANTKFSIASAYVVLRVVDLVLRVLNFSIASTQLHNLVFPVHFARHKVLRCQVLPVLDFLGSLILLFCAPQPFKAGLTLHAYFPHLRQSTKGQPASQPASQFKVRHQRQDAGSSVRK